MELFHLLLRAGLSRRTQDRAPAVLALSKARALPGEQVMRRIFELDAGRADAELGIGAAWHGMETTAIDGTTIELFNNDELAEAFGVPSGGTKPKIGIAAHVRTGSRRWIAAAIGGYCDGENTLADELEDSFTAGIVSTAGRGFFSMDRWIRFSARGAHLVWRVLNGAKSVPFKTLRTLPDGGHVTADTCCPHCGKRPASGNDPIALLIAGILAQPPHRDRPARTSGRTAFQRQNWHTEEVMYTITIVPSNLPKATISLES